MSATFFKKLAVSAVAVVLLAGAVAAQTVVPDTARVPFVVNANAVVSAAPAAGGAAETMNVTAGEEKNLHIPLPGGVSVRMRRQPDNRYAVTVGPRGNVTLNLPAQSYQNADVALYSISGRLVMRGNASTFGTAQNISRSNVTPGVYLLSVKGANGNAVSSRVPHRGGVLNIRVALDGGAALKRSAADEGVPYAITVSAPGYADTSYTLNISAGMNDRQDITLRAVYTVTFDSRGGSLVEPRFVALPGGLVTDRPNDPTRPGFTFSGWYTEAGYINAWHLGSDIVSSNMVLYARWTVAAHIITFNASGGTVSPASGTTGDGGVLASLPTPARGDYTFNGWFTAATGGTEVGINTVFYGDAIIYAQWTPPPLVYNGRTYRTVEIGGMTWMAENLFCPNNSDSLCMGTYHAWDRAVSACPAGWRLSTDADWESLIAAVGDSSGTKLKSQTGWRDSYGNPVEGGTDNFGFSAQPDSHFDFDRWSLEGRNTYTVFWVRTADGSDQALNAVIMSSLVTISQQSNRTLGLSVRCVKN